MLHVFYWSLLSCRKLLQELRKKRTEYDEMMEKLQREVSSCTIYNVQVNEKGNIGIVGKCSDEFGDWCPCPHMKHTHTTLCAQYYGNNLIPISALFSQCWQ